MSSPLQTVCWPFKSRDPCLFFATSCYERQVLKCTYGRKLSGSKIKYILKSNWQSHCRQIFPFFQCRIKCFIEFPPPYIYIYIYMVTEIFSKKSISSLGCTRWNHTVPIRVRYVGIIRFVFMLFNLLRIKFTQQTLCCIIKPTLKHQQKPIEN